MEKVKLIALHRTEMADDSDGQQPFGADLNGR